MSITNNEPGMKKKSKMQNVSFDNIDEFFEFIPENELKMVNTLRQLIFNYIPGCKEKLSYNVPFYRRHSGICFIWPSSVTWGNVKQAGTVRLGFIKGYLLRDETNYLDKGNRKQVYWKDFTDPKEIDIDLLKSYLFEAMLVDEQLKKRVKK